MLNQGKIQAFTFDETSSEFRVLDQTLLPKEVKYVNIEGTKDAFRVIKGMMARGAPCIAAVGCLSIILELDRSSCFKDTQEVTQWLRDKSQFLIGARPTAVNLKQALDKLVDLAKSREDLDLHDFKTELSKFCIRALRTGQKANIQLGVYGAEELVKTANHKGKLTVLTHCNTGALATVGHGTALGVIRSLYDSDNLNRAYCTETRPYNQGSRLTAWELVQDKIPATLIADNMVAYLMEKQQIDAVVVGADRVAANGDTANKIGTLQIAVLAKHYGVPFYVAAPTQSIDMNTMDANSIEIEQRPADELRRIGTLQLAPDEIDVWNPCFDVTPSGLITGIITEFGICRTNDINNLKNIKSFNTDSALF